MFPRLLCLLILLVPPALAVENAFVRVNQLGYARGTESRAYLMSPGPEHKASFRVLRSDGTLVFSGRIGEQLGHWGGFTVYALDFNIVSGGTYTIMIEG